MKQLFLALFFVLMLASCSPHMFNLVNSKNMNQLELGMSRQQLIEIMGKYYSISEKKMENANEIEVISYRNYPYEDEFYQFVFVNDHLEEWYREIVPSYQVQDDHH